MELHVHPIWKRCTPCVVSAHASSSASKSTSRTGACYDISGKEGFDYVVRGLCITCTCTSRDHTCWHWYLWSFVWKVTRSSGGCLKVTHSNGQWNPQILICWWLHHYRLSFTDRELKLIYNRQSRPKAYSVIHLLDWTFLRLLQMNMYPHWAQ